MLLIDLCVVPSIYHLVKEVSKIELNHIKDKEYLSMILTDNRSMESYR